MDNYLKLLGHWPTNVNDAIKKREILVISPKDTLDFIHGKEYQNKISFYLSNDTVHAGILTLTKGKISEIECHKGDEVLWVLQGNVQVRAWQGKDDDTVFQECYHLKTNDKFLIPEGYKHQYLNLADGSAKIFFTISPEI